MSLLRKVLLLPLFSICLLTSAASAIEPDEVIQLYRKLLTGLRAQIDIEAEVSRFETTIVHAHQPRRGLFLSLFEHYVRNGHRLAEVKPPELGLLMDDNETGSGCSIGLEKMITEKNKLKVCCANTRFMPAVSTTGRLSKLLPTCSLNAHSAEGH